uniref:Secreted protein n=1 Tax=Cyclopterus lumpus TaxID=8103 RepID=A0A8C3G1T1_CYCLU
MIFTFFLQLSFIVDTLCINCTLLSRILPPATCELFITQMHMGQQKLLRQKIKVNLCDFYAFYLTAHLVANFFHKYFRTCRK